MDGKKGKGRGFPRQGTGREGGNRAPLRPELVPVGTIQEALELERRAHLPSTRPLTNPLATLIPEGASRRRKQGAFLRAYRAIGNLTATLNALNITHNTHRNWTSQDPLFQAHWEEAQRVVKQRRIDDLEAEAYHQALVGDLKPVVNLGRVVTYVREKNTRVLETLLKAESPEKYRENRGTGVKVGVGADGERYVKVYQGFDPDQV